ELGGNSYTYATLAYLNSKLVKYVANTFNPTVNITVGDIERIPYVKPSEEINDLLGNIALRALSIKQKVLSYSIIEPGFITSPLKSNTTIEWKSKVKYFLDFENHLLTQILIAEAIINEIIFGIYDLTERDI